VLGPGQFPGADAVDEAVRLVRDRPDRRRRQPEVELGQRRADAVAGPAAGQIQVFPAGRDRPRPGDAGVAIAPDHGDHAVDQVTQAVGELVVGPGDQPPDGEVGVTHPRHLAEQPPAHRVGAVLGGQRGRVGPRTTGPG
jgi:hypothetical protein